MRLAASAVDVWCVAFALATALDLIRPSSAHGVGARPGMRRHTGSCPRCTCTLSAHARSVHTISADQVYGRDVVEEVALVIQAAKEEKLPRVDARAVSRPHWHLLVHQLPTARVDARRREERHLAPLLGTHVERVERRIEVIGGVPVRVRVRARARVRKGSGPPSLRHQPRICEGEGEGKGEGEGEGKE